jgi:hypothetical protein
MFTLQTFVAFVVTWCLLALAAILAASTQHFERVKITIVERIFHAGRDKLMTIPAFAWAYARIMALRTYLETLAVWQAMSRAVRVVKERGRRLLVFARGVSGR